MMNSTVHVPSVMGHHERGHLEGMLNLVPFQVDLSKDLSKDLLMGHLVAYWMGRWLDHSMDLLKEHFSLVVEIVYCDCS
tara:strand:- start:268 stop:504 length:237 start_codon:yes stop_codon:yes gene_type:complete